MPLYILSIIIKCKVVSKCKSKYCYYYKLLKKNYITKLCSRIVWMCDGYVNMINQNAKSWMFSKKKVT